MNRTTKTFSVSLILPIADALDRIAQNGGLSPGLKIAEIVESHFLGTDEGLDDQTKQDLRQLRQLRDRAIVIMEGICEKDGFSADITLKTFAACQADTDWLSEYESYIGGNAVASGNPRKTNANQTIGSRIKSALRAGDLTDGSGRVQRGRAPAGSIIQTYQLLSLR